MTRMTRPDCAVICNLINTHTQTHIHTHDLTGVGGKFEGNIEYGVVKTDEY